MRKLIINDKWDNWKFGDTDAIMTFEVTDDDQVPDFANKTLTFKIASASSDKAEDYVASAPEYVSDKSVILKTSDISTLTPGTYAVELWAMDNGSQKNAVYPSESFAFFTIDENTMQVTDIDNVSSKTLQAVYAELLQKVGALKKGAQGDPGKTPTLVMGSVTEIASNQQPSASLVPSQNDPNSYTLNLQIPQGQQGKPGEQGVPGVGIKGLDGTNGITPSIDPTTKHWMIGNTDTGVIAQGQPGKDADPSKYVTIESYKELRQNVQDNSTALKALQDSTTVAELQTQVTKLVATVGDLSKKVKASQSVKPDTPKSDEPAKSDSSDDQPAKSDTPTSSADPASTPASSSTTTPDSTPTSASKETSATPASDTTN